MSSKIKELDVVALLRDIPEAKLVQGQVGRNMSMKMRHSLVEITL